jgi:hypothetical protein
MSELGADPNNKRAQAVALSELTGYPLATTTADLARWDGQCRMPVTELKTAQRRAGSRPCLSQPVRDQSYRRSSPATRGTCRCSRPSIRATLRALHKNSKDAHAQTMAISQLTRLSASAGGAGGHATAPASRQLQRG